ncbi:MAG: hypothetical protein EPO25_06280 [Gammaproteobacteria bacterium]|nr:MAG: hypothetical protein EPO25_06280 [Gammaproteobacteria bacterium]
MLKRFTFPSGLYGANAATFLIPKGVPKPVGNPGHSAIYDFNTLDCQGATCVAASRAAAPTAPPPRDLVVDFGTGSSIRMVGMADNFRCDDPAYAKVEKTETGTVVFANGTTIRLCKADKVTPAERINLSRQYVSSRTGILEIPRTARRVDFDSNDRRLYAAIAAQFLKDHPEGHAWNADHPEWKRVAAIIENDVREIFARLAADPRLSVSARQVEETFVSGLAAQLTPSDLRELFYYYSRRPGAQFAKVQARLFNELASGLAAMKEQLTAGRRPVQRTIRPDAGELRELLGLFDEVVKIHLAMLDPGPRKDRSGIQAIPVMVAAIVEAQFADLNAIWKKLPKEDRSAILAWRNSPLGRKERTAIFESAKAIRAVLDANAEVSRLSGALAKYEEKWLTLIREAQE